ncbi:hypothetical protein K491DRAFT_380478 [Lophiostoma macrostomum CBS 122681]|uniref:Uncharacterized protein n=1 Tax=Lophiostoma macrostomum CBS 122681 TaxID=1314788 RepID=A0A6A6TSS1_9PLEO|nr:hypothetical protein K491DRAFT_380478 [Lophiostoma macrostomum CBS 122681]
MDPDGTCTNCRPVARDCNYPPVSSFPFAHAQSLLQGVHVHLTRRKYSVDDEFRNTAHALQLFLYLLLVGVRYVASTTECKARLDVTLLVHLAPY